MSWVAAGVAGGAIVGGLIQSNAAKKAAGIQGEASAAATAENARQFDISRADLAPWREAGKASVGELTRRMGLGTTPALVKGSKSLSEIAENIRQSGRYSRPSPQPGPGDIQGYLAWKRNPTFIDEDGVMAEAQRLYDAQTVQGGTGAGPEGDLLRKFTLDDFDNDPVIQKSLQFGLSEGTKALSRMRRGQGTFNSGGTAKALSRYTTDYVGQQAGSSRDRFVQDQTNVYNRLAGVAGTGQTAATNTAQLGAQTATNNANLNVGAANARGAASIAQGNAMTNALSQGGNAFQQKYMMDSLRAPSSSPGYTSDDYRWSM
jgi:hypothetical protein